MNQLSYKIMLDRYSQKDLEQKTLKEGSIVIATVSEVNPKYPQKEVCVVTKIEGDTVHLKHYFDEEVTYTLPRNKIQVPIETTQEQLWDRIANGIVKYEKDKEKWRKEFRELLDDWKFVPGGRIMAMMGADNQDKLTAFNCFVIPCPHDSRGGAIETLNVMTEIMARGGGVGINISTLRPKNAIVRGVNGISSGAVSWGEGYSFYTGLIEQGGSRRGALIEILGVWHPDIEDFISIKMTPGKMENANLSVAITDEFMDAVKNDKDWDLIFPDTAFEKYDSEWDGDITAWKAKGYPIKVYKTVKARDLWNQIIERAWASGEPGLIFIDRMNHFNNGYYFEKLIGTNPCVTGDTLILTDKGYKEIKSLIGQKVKVWNGFEFSEVVPKITGHNQKMIKVKFSNGMELTCTLYHKFVTTEGKKEARHLKVGDKLQKWNYPVIEGTIELDERIAYTRGFVSGDGTDKCRNLTLYGEKQQLIDYLDITSTGKKCSNPELYGDRLSVRVPAYCVEDKYWVPDTTYTVKTRLNWLAGLIDADGCLNDKNGSIAIWSINEEFIKKIQLMLTTLGVHSSYNIGTYGGDKLLPDGNRGKKLYHTQNCYRLVISAWSVAQLMKLGLKTHRVPLIANPNRDASRYIQVTELQVLDELEDTVYCFNEPIRHLGCFNGIVTAQCGEQPLPAWGVCNLGHINLAKVPIIDGNIDYKYLRRIVHLAVRFLDNVIDITPYFLEQNKEVQLNERRIGLGTMGLAELLIKLKIRYGSKECIKFLEELYSKIRDYAYEASVELAKEKGPFPKFDAEKYLQGNFIKQLPSHIKNKIRKYGIRNVALLTQAPTGSTGTLCDTSTGIEPFYAFEYTRSGRLGTDIQYVKVAKEWMEQHPGEPLPDYFVTALQLTPEEHVTVMATIQKYVDASISKTCNIPSDWTVEQVADLYRLAYELGCKGLTVYRDGSRQEQVLKAIDNNKVNPHPQVEVNPHPGSELKYGERMSIPENIRYVKMKFKTGCGKIRMLVGFDENNNPIEIYNVVSSSGGCMMNIQGLAITISEFLRRGGKIEDLYENAQEAGNCPSYMYKRGQGHDELYGKSCFHGMIKAIMEYQSGKISDNLIVQGGGYITQAAPQKIEVQVKLPKNKQCPSCGNTLVAETGCWQCKNCGFSVCE